MPLKRLPGAGWLALVGGGEFSFDETVEADRAWVEHCRPGRIGFIPAASGSTEYGDYFTEYMRSTFDRTVEVIPVYRHRDARRGKNLDAIAASAAVYLGGGVTDHLLDAVLDEPAAEALATLLAEGGVVVAMAAAAQTLGVAARSLLTRQVVPGLAWLMGGVVEPNFDPGHDRRLRQLMAAPGVSWGLGLPAGSAVLLGPDGAIETVGTSFVVHGEDGDLEILQ